MRQSTKIYLALIAIFIVSLGFFYWHPGGDFIQALAAIPVVGSVVATLVQILRDQAAHERAFLVQSTQNRFSLGASSHMANVAFDKHVIFSEEYAQEVLKTLSTLFRNGPSLEILTHTTALFDLRQKHAVWLTRQIDVDLEKFESALRQIGAAAGYVHGTPGANDRQERLDFMYRKFAEVMGWAEWAGEQLTDELAISMLITRIRTILGTEELTEIRVAVVAKAIDELRKR